MTAMSDEGQAVAFRPAAPASAQGVQPRKTPDDVLEAPVPLTEVLRGVGKDHVEDTCRDAENLERRLADQQLRDALARSNFTGRQYQRFETELARYGLAVLRSWMHSGYVFQLVADRGFPLHPNDRELDELFRDRDARDELATITIAVALGRFRERALLGGGWRVEGGASLTTYFMGSCLYVFPNEFRKRRVEQEKWARAQRAVARTSEPTADPGADPAVRMLGNHQVLEDLRRVDPRTGMIAALTIDGYSQRAISELLGVSVRAVEGALYRWRIREKSRDGQEGDQK
ncbi:MULTISPECIES: RNA polymerase sigma factor [Pseudofrankia]|uniref:RNA polymerase sigma factor n=1 Tax=Pseudofrankia TaxID=2994363 RepID=UPI000687A2FA|nr:MULTISPECIES: sigma-70 family RNA polymerase sigma factor [Pseudofrankia]